MKPKHSTLLNKIYQGDCLEVLKTFDDNCVDTIITDPPYGIGFMGKEWDTFSPEYIKKGEEYEKERIKIKPRTDGRNVSRNGKASKAGSYDFSYRGLVGFQKAMTPFFQEMLRVAKPGATLLCFGGTRTFHRLACAIEDAGWVIKDTLCWLYGSGFPKATDISKQLDKKAGKEREVIGEYQRPDGSKPRKNVKAKAIFGNANGNDQMRTASSTPEAQLWNGWKSHGLKPSYEPIIMAMKPNEGSYANNALKHGVAGLNIDGGRIDGEPWSRPTTANIRGGNYGNSKGEEKKPRQNLTGGRFPANLLLDEESAKMLDEQSGELKSGARKRTEDNKNSIFGFGGGESRESQGGASRFFYVAKSSRAERNLGCGGLEEKQVNDGRNKLPDNAYQRGKTFRVNSHPTVKPLKLMEYLCLLTKTPSGGIVLDPFAGSGTTGMACKKLKRNYILIEKEKEYCRIAEARINAIQEPLL